jgi:hypothetical protein
VHLRGRLKSGTKINTVYPMNSDLIEYDKYVKLILENKDHEGIYANRLLKALARGYDNSFLKQMLYSENEQVVKAGCFILATSGTYVENIDPRLLKLLDSNSRLILTDILTAVSICPRYLTHDFLQKLIIRCEQFSQIHQPYAALLFSKVESEMWQSLQSKFEFDAKVLQWITKIIALRHYTPRELADRLKGNDTLDRVFAMAITIKKLDKCQENDNRYVHHLIQALIF